MPRNVKYDDWICEFGSIEIVPDDLLHSFVVRRDANGIVTSKEWFADHLVCCGVDKCYTCGRDMS